MLPTVHSRVLLRELDTDGHSPLYCICDDGRAYYVKYRSGRSMKPYEINCLAFEAVCTRMLEALEIPTPELAIVTMEPTPDFSTIVRINARYLKPGITALGSAEMLGSRPLTGSLEVVRKPSQYHRLENPDDLLRIAIFDLWVDNRDRHADNHNILLQHVPGERTRFVAIDHSFAFGGVNGMRTFGPATLPSKHRSLYQSPYFASVIRFMPLAEQKRLSTDFVDLLERLDVPAIAHETFASLPSAWGIDTALEARIVAFLQAPARLTALRNLCC